MSTIDLRVLRTDMDAGTAGVPCRCTQDMVLDPSVRITETGMGDVISVRDTRLSQRPVGDIAEDVPEDVP